MKNLFTILFVGMITNLSFAQCDDFEVEIDFTNPDCYDMGNGHIHLSVDGVDPFTIDITNAEGEKENSGDSGSANFIEGGWYYIYVEDGEGCTFIDSVEIIEPAEITIDLTTIAAVDFDECDGMASVDTVYNYQGSYEAISYDWSSTPEDVDEVTDLCPEVGVILQVEDSAGCFITTSFEVGALASINSHNLGAISVFINPQTGELNIRENQFQNVELTLFNLAGETVFSNLINDQSVVLTPMLENGVYLYTITHQGENIQTGKLKF